MIFRFHIIIFLVIFFILPSTTLAQIKYSQAPQDQRIIEPTANAIIDGKPVVLKNTYKYGVPKEALETLGFRKKRLMIFEDPQGKTYFTTFTGNPNQAPDSFRPFQQLYIDGKRVVRLASDYSPKMQGNNSEFVFFDEDPNFGESYAPATEPGGVVITKPGEEVKPITLNISGDDPNKPKITVTDSSGKVLVGDPISGRKIDEKCTFRKDNMFYCMLAPIGIFTDDKQFGRVQIGPEGFTKFLNNLVRFAISIATGLAVVMIVIGGVQYSSTDAISGKSDGAARIKQALSGLILALVSYVILNTINPDVFATGLKLETNPATGEFVVLGQSEHDGVDAVGGTAAGRPADGGSLTPAGSGSTSGLPVQGAFNQTQQNTLKDNGIEPTNKIIPDGSGNQFVGGKGSVFGGPSDHDNGKGDQQLPLLPGKTAKMLDVDSYYVAFRWDYTKTSPETLRNSCVEVYIPGAPNKKYFIAKPVDWGPGLTTKSVDVSPAIERDAGMNLTGAEIGIRIIPCP